MDTPIYIRTLPNTARVTSALYLSESFDTAHSQYYSNEGTTTMDTHLVYVYSPTKRVTNNALNTNKCVIFVHNRPFRVYDIFRVSAFFFCLDSKEDEEEDEEETTKTQRALHRRHTTTNALRLRETNKRPRRRRRRRRRRPRRRRRVCPSLVKTTTSFFFVLWWCSKERAS